MRADAPCTCPPLLPLPRVPLPRSASPPQDALGFTSATAVVELQAGAHVGAQVKLLPLAAPIPFQAEHGGIIQTEQVRVSIPPDAAVDALGQPVTGTVHVTIAPLDPTSQLDAMPGPLEGTAAADGESVQLESFFMAEVSLSSNGAQVQLAPGKSATLEFVLPAALATQFQAGDSVPAWWFDLDAGHWREEGSGTIQPSSSQPGKLAWVVQVKHFTWWNCDAPWTNKSCVNVLVVDGHGAPVKGAVVNEDCICSDKQGQPCYGGPSGTQGVGVCHGGTIGCDLFGNVICQGQQLPAPEACWTATDEDCNGVSEACETGPAGWASMGSMASPRLGHTATLLSNGKVLVSGGGEER